MNLLFCTLRVCFNHFRWVLIALASGLSVQAAGTALFPQSVASGDPTPSSVILWTRVADSSLSTNAPDPVLSLEVASDPGFATVVFSRTNLLARRTFDFCVKTKVAGLSPRTRYYYRFGYAGQFSPTGRTQTAPAANDPAPVRFAYLSCQDYIGRYYNTLAELATRDADNIDFVVHLGDYIYETVNDASFQNTNLFRQIRFRDLAGAKNIGGAGSPVYAASSLDNYRQLYETYHSDPVLQDLHERVPMINIWDDHEYANDCYGANSTDSAGRINEFDPARRQRAEQAFFEFIPIDQGYDDQGVNIGPSMLFPNARIYRDLSFGSLVDLFLTDYRSYHPSPLIAADAFPATIVMTEEVVSNFFGPSWTVARASFDPYVNIDLPAYAALKAQLVPAATLLLIQAGADVPTASADAAKGVQGNVSVTVLNAALKQFGATTPFTPAVIATLPRGLSYAYLGKQDFFTELGSRYLLVRDTFKLYSAYREMLDPATQNVYGDAQFAHITGSVTASKAPWKIATSSVSLCPIGFDFGNPPIQLPPTFPSQLRVALQLNADDFDGMPNMRNTLLNLYGSNNAVVISGDIHASFVTSYQTANGHKVPEFTGPSVSSESFQEGLAATVKNDPSLSGVQGADQLVAATDFLAADYIGKSGFATPIDVHSDAHGYVIMDANADRLLVDYHLISNREVTNDLTSPSMATVRAGKFRTLRYAVTQGSGGLSTRVVPSLAISRAVNGDLTIQWPQSAADCQLQSTSTLGPSGPWQTVPQTPTNVPGSGLLQLIIPAADVTAYYRLLCPTPL